MPYRKCASSIDGMPSKQIRMPEKKPNVWAKHILQLCLQMGIPTSSCWLAAGICFSNQQTNGQESQRQRAEVLFETYPDLKEAYSLTHSLRMIFSKNTIKDAARLSLARWYDKVDDSGFKSFDVIAATLYEHYDEVLNFFVNRATNAFEESFYAKIKAFRAALRGVTDIKFFLFRLIKLYA